MISETKLGELLQEFEERITTVENKYEEDTQTLGKILKDQVSINKLVEESISRLEAKAKEPSVSDELYNITTGQELTKIMDSFYALGIRFDKLDRQFFELLKAINPSLDLQGVNTGDE